MSDSNTLDIDLAKKPSADLNGDIMDDSHIQEVLLSKQIRTRSKRKKQITLGIIILVMALVGFGLYKYWGTKNNPGFLTMTVAKGTVTDAIQCTGTLEPVRKSQMGFKSDEAITAINVKPGDYVTAGQILAQQDATTLEASLRQAQSQLTQDEISVQNLILTHNAAARTLSQQQELFNAGAVSRSDYDKASDALRKAELDLDSARARLINDQAKVDQARSDLAGATLVAPFDGIIGAVNAQVGQIIGLNASSNNLLTVMSEDLQMSALVNEADISRIQIGQNVEFTTSANGDKMFTGKVVTITPEAKTVSNVQYYPVVVSCNDPNRQLKSGMSVSAKIVLSRQSDVLTVPMMAVSYAQTYNKAKSGASPSSTGQPSQTSSTRGSSRSSSSQTPSTTGGATASKNTVVLVLENNQPVSREVVLGLNDGQNYAVISGLNEGEQIVVGSSSTSSAGSSQNNQSGSSSSQNRNNQRSGGMPVQVMRP